MQRDAFISYSHKADVPLAASVHEGLHRIGRPWRSVRALNVFRDTDSLGASTDLAGSILKELQRSRYFLYIASPEAAASRWVREELLFWRDHPEAEARDRFLIALSDGEIHWDEAAGDFDWVRTTAIPAEVLRGVFRTEPLWVDLRKFRARESAERALKPGEFRDKVATLAAAVRGCTKDELESEDLRQQRRRNRTKNSALALLAVLAVATTSASFYANAKREEALARARTSASQALAARAVQIADTDPRRSAQYALYAEQVKPTSESAQALARAVAANANTARHFQGGSGVAADFVGSGGSSSPTRVAVSRDGSMFAYCTGFDADDPKVEQQHIHLFDIRAGKDLPVLQGKGSPLGGGVFELSADGGLLVMERSFNVIDVWDVRRGKLLREIVASKGEDLANAAMHLKAFALSRDGSRMAAAFHEPNVGPLRMAVWDTASGAELSRSDAGADAVTLSFDDAGKLHADASRSKPPTSGAALVTAPTPDNGQILIGSENATVAVYDTQRRKQRTLGSFGFQVQSVSASGDGMWVGAGSNDGAVSLFRGSDPTLRTLRNDGGLRPGELSEDGRIGFRKNAKGGTDVWLLTDPKSGPSKVGSILGEAEVFTASRDGRRVVFADTGGGLAVWDGLTSGIKDRTLFTKGSYLYNGKGTHTVETVGDDQHVVGAWEQGLRVVDLRTMEVSQMLTDKKGVDRLAVSKDARVLAATDVFGTATVWRWTGDDKLRRVRETKVTGQRINDVVVSDDGSKVAVVDSDSRISVLDVSDGTVVTASVVARNAHTHAVFSPDSRLVMQASDSDTESRLNFWDAATGDTLGSWPLGGPGFVRIFPGADGGLLTLTADGSLTQRSIDITTWRSTLCALVPDELSGPEYDRYLSDLDVSAPCRR
ncbi:TIR domain-containing protein [Streptomyces sp. NBC_01443]|uniref:TIR domain-containing protein n=1 Tax=Streptomyces sp. NBC_01443 TaxID=2903868 RepID=UPI002252CA3C|nr:TIR domain-containing protein [Streptomyces sp. NBC_01443]MCX4626432.1 TIR domain-containing protein [Streptomyces sp. NBC_01443]